MKMLTTLRSHLRYWGENYYMAPVVLGLLIGAIYLVGWLTGRPVLEDPAAIVGWLLNAVGAVVVVTLTGLTQHFLFGYRSHGETPSLASDIYDACVSCFLLCFFAVLVFGLIR